MKQLKQAQKMRIIMSGVAIYTTVKQLREGLFGFTTQNSAAFQALAALEKMRSGEGIAEQCACGLGATFEGLQVQLDIL